MVDPTQAIIKILFQHTSAPSAPIVGSTELCNLGIDLLDLPMLILDLEDAFQICIRYDEYTQVKTVRELAACVICNVQRSVREARLLAATPRTRRSWTSTVAEQRCN
jgi:acyl carrier protein